MEIASRCFQRSEDRPDDRHLARSRTSADHADATLGRHVHCLALGVGKGIAALPLDLDDGIDNEVSVAARKLPTNPLRDQ